MFTHDLQLTVDTAVVVPTAATAVQGDTPAVPFLGCRSQ